MPGAGDDLPVTDAEGNLIGVALVVQTWREGAHIHIAITDESWLDHLRRGTVERISLADIPVILRPGEG